MDDNRRDIIVYLFFIIILLIFCIYYSYFNIGLKFTFYINCDFIWSNLIYLVLNICIKVYLNNKISCGKRLIIIFYCI